MLLLRGGAAHSRFRIEKLQAQLKNNQVDCLSINTQYIHLVDVVANPETENLSVLEN